MRRYRNLLIVMALAASAVVTLNASAYNPSHGRDACGEGATYVGRSLSAPLPTSTVSGELPAGSELLMRFVNVSDTHIIDDEASTAMNGSWLEALLEPAIGNGSAQRLQEEYTDEVLNALEKTINTCAARPGANLELMIATGDLTDNMTLNELRRYIDNLDGVSGKNPDKKTAFEKHCGYQTVDPLGRPKAGAQVCTPEMMEAFSLMTGRHRADAPTNEPTDSPEYQFTPTRSALQIADTYVESQMNGSHHIAPGLPEKLRCDAGPGCPNTRLAIPHYAVFGNHDASVRGTLTMQKAFNAGTAGFGRYFLESQREFINEWFETTVLDTTGPRGHGFNHVDENRWTNTNDRDDGYYAFDSANGKVRMIVLNTIFDGVRDETHRGGATRSETKGLVSGSEVTPAPATSEQGFIDQAQLDWLKVQLDASGDKAVLVLSHHPDRSFSYSQYGSELPEDLNKLLGNYKNVVAHIAGHTHENIINPCAKTLCSLKGSNLGNEDPLASSIANGFWRIETSSMIDFPQESRIIEVYELPNNGGFAIRSTMIQADQSDESGISHRLAMAEAECKTSYMLGGPLSSGPYNQARAQKVFDNLNPLGNLNPGEADIRSKFCYQGLDESAGKAKDRDVLLLP